MESRISDGFGGFSGLKLEVHDGVFGCQAGVLLEGIWIRWLSRWAGYPSGGWVPEEMASISGYEIRLPLAWSSRSIFFMLFLIPQRV